MEETNYSIQPDEKTYLITYKPVEDEGTAGILPSVINVAISAIGAGILALPFALHKAGFVNGLILLFFVGLLTIYSLLLLIKSMQESKLYVYEKVAEYAFGRGALYFVKIASVFMTIGTIVGYLVIAGDVFPTVFKSIFKGVLNEYLMDRNAITLIVMLTIILPLSSLRNMKSLSFTSFIGVAASLYLVIFVVVKRLVSPSDDIKDPNNPFVAFNFSTDIFLAIPIIVYANNCHILLPPIIKELKNKTTLRMNSIPIFGTLLFQGIYIVISIFGYLSFYGKTQDNILKGYPPGDIFASIGRLLVGVEVILACPLQAHACRGVLEDAFFGKKGNFSWIRHILWVAGIGFICYVIAALVPFIQIVFGFVGSTVGLTIMYLIPALLYLKICVFKERSDMKNVKSWIRAIFPILLIIIGLFMGIVCTTILTIDTFFRKK